MLSWWQFQDALSPPYVKEPWQHVQQAVAVDLEVDECGIVRCRGGSKTYDMMEVLLYWAFCGFESIFWTSTATQMKQPQLYLRRLINQTFLKYAVKRPISEWLLKREVTFQNEGRFRIINLTEDNARSPRCDVSYYDEQSRAEEDAYEASSPVLSVSRIGKLIHGSTPEKGSVFESNVRRLEKEGKPVMYRSWYEIGFINKKFIERERATKPPWFFRQEYECSFEAPAGRVFTNVIYGDYSEILLGQRDQVWEARVQHFGLDWNPSAGHYLVGSRWADNWQLNFVTMEMNLGTVIRKAPGETRPDVMDTLIQILLQNPRSYIEIEDGGTNMGYCDMVFRELDNMLETGEISEAQHRSLEDRIYRRPWDTMGKNKMRSITLLLPRTIYVNPEITPDVADWLDKAHWDEEATEFPKLEKDPEQHPLDAYLHSGWVGFEDE